MKKTIWKKTLSLVTLSLFANSSIASLIIEDLYITNPDGSSLTAAQWQEVQYSTRNGGTEIASTGGVGSNGMNYIYLDMQTPLRGNSRSELVKVKYGKHERLVKAYWSVAAQGSMTTKFDRIVEYSILDRNTAVPSVTSRGLELCESDLYPRRVPDSSSSIARVYTDTLWAYPMNSFDSHEVMAYPESGPIVLSSTWPELYTIPYAGFDGKENYYPMAHESWSLRSLESLTQRKTVNDSYPVLTRRSDRPMGLSLLTADWVERMDFDGQVVRNDKDEKIMQCERVTKTGKGETLYGTPPTAMQDAIPVVF